MTDSPLHALSVAIDQYGQASIKIYEFVKRLGMDVRKQLPIFLGDDAVVYGVPPEDRNWKAYEYRYAAFSFHGQGLLEVASIQQGLAVAIPHLRDKGQHWVRIVVDYIPEGGDLTVMVGDHSITGVAEDYRPEVVEEICRAIFQALLDEWERPVGQAMSSGRRRIGFLPPQ